MHDIDSHESQMYAKEIVIFRQQQKRDCPVKVFYTHREMRALEKGKWNRENYALSVDFFLWDWGEDEALSSSNSFPWHGNFLSEWFCVVVCYIYT